MSFSLPRISHASNGRQQKVKDEIEKRREEHSVDEEIQDALAFVSNLMRTRNPMTRLHNPLMSILYLMGRREGERRREEV